MEVRESSHVNGDNNEWCPVLAPLQAWDFLLLQEEGPGGRKWLPSGQERQDPGWHC